MSDQSVADTSKMHYMDMVEEGIVGDQAQSVKEALEKLSGPATINELGHTIELSGMDNSTISGRLNDLKDLGIVTDLPDDKREDKFSGITCKPWKLEEDHRENEPDEWTNGSDDLEDDEDLDGLFKNDKQSEVCDDDTQKTGKVCSDNEQKRVLMEDGEVKV